MNNGTATTPDRQPAPRDRILGTLAYIAATQTGSEGAALRHALYACLLADELGLGPAAADDRAADPVDEAERAINDRARELIAAARQASTEPPWEPKPGDIVTQAGTDGTWVVRGWEDDDFVWVHRPDVRMVPTIGRNTGGMIDLAGWRNEPEHEELAAAVDLRPVEHSQDNEVAVAKPWESALAAELAEATGGAR